MFSCSKGVLADLRYRLVEDGRVELDAPIADYWPAFGDHGKAEITLRDAMSHRAGLPALDIDLSRDDVLAWDPVIRAIEAQRPAPRARERTLYHAPDVRLDRRRGDPADHGAAAGSLLPCRNRRHPRAADLDRDSRHARSTVAWMEPPLPDEDSAAAREAARLARDRHPALTAA